MLYTQDILINNIGTFFDIESREKIINPIVNATFEAYNVDKQVVDTLHVIPRSADVSSNFIYISPAINTNRIILSIKSDTISFSEIIFYTDSNKQYKPIYNLDVSHSNRQDKRYMNLSLLFDQLSGTGVWNVFQKSDSKKIFFELDSSCQISAIKYIPYVKDVIKENFLYRLYYWDKEWRFHSEIYAKGSTVLFNNVPEGALYRINSNMPSNYKHIERIFTYEKGIIYWW